MANSFSKSVSENRNRKNMRGKNKPDVVNNPEKVKDDADSLSRDAFITKYGMPPNEARNMIRHFESKERADKAKEKGNKELESTFRQSQRRRHPGGYNKGGYANCGASMKATQKSTNMAYGGMARKK